MARRAATRELALPGEPALTVDNAREASPLAASEPTGAVTPVAARHPPGRHRLALRNFAHNAGLALWLFLPLEPPRRGAPELRRQFSSDARAIVWGAAFVLTFIAVGDFAAAWRADRPPAFNIWGAHALATRLLVAVAVLFLLALTARRLDRIVPLLAGYMALEAIAAAIGPLLGVAHPAAAKGFGLASCVVLGRIVWRELPCRPLAAVAAGAAIWGLLVTLPPIPLFRAPHARPGPQLDIERVYTRQEALVRAALESVRPSEADVEELFFVGFASYAPQDVFENEARHVATLFADQLRARDRAILLVNSHATVDELPLANGRNLAAVLRGVAGKMGPEDVLFLHMTSHGSADHEFAVYFNELNLNDLTAAELGEIVNDAAAPWRVVVVSACYSGGYIDALKAPRAMVITASRADRASFGCEHGREYTYFGEAFYRDSVHQGGAANIDFVAAFENARRIVADRERREDRKPSEPQLWIGAEMAAKLRVPATTTTVTGT